MFDFFGFYALYSQLEHCGLGSCVLAGGRVVTQRDWEFSTVHIPPFLFGKELKSTKLPSMQSSRHFSSVVYLFMKAAEMDSGLSTPACF